MLEKLILVFLVWKISSQELVSDPKFTVEHPERCPQLVGQIYPDSRGVNVSSSGGQSVTYTAVGVRTLSDCVSSCCDSDSCHAALLSRPGGECKILGVLMTFRDALRTDLKSLGVLNVMLFSLS